MKCKQPCPGFELGSLFVYFVLFYGISTPVGDLMHTKFWFGLVGLYGILLRIDLWQSCQSGILGTGCSNHVNRKTARAVDKWKQITWITGRKNVHTLWNYIFTDNHSLTVNHGCHDQSVGTWIWNHKVG